MGFYLILKIKLGNKLAHVWPLSLRWLAAKFAVSGLGPGHYNKNAS